jgi:hypothetical protein
MSASCPPHLQLRYIMQLWHTTLLHILICLVFGKKAKVNTITSDLSPSYRGPKIWSALENLLHYSTRNERVPNRFAARLMETVPEKLKLSLCFTKHSTIKTCRGTEVISPRILNLGNIWRLMVSFTALERAPGSQPGRPQSRSALCGANRETETEISCHTHTHTHTQYATAGLW